MLRKRKSEFLQTLQKVKYCSFWKSLLLSSKILEWQEKEVEMIAYNVGISFLKVIINGDNDHLFFYPDKKMNCGYTFD